MNIKKFCSKHSDQLIISLILLTIYVAEAAIRPLAAPCEYVFIHKLHSIFPEFPDIRLLFRTPAILLTFAGAVAVYLISKRWNFKHPGRSVVFYLLFPPVFYFGSAATLTPLFSAGTLWIVYGMICSAGKVSVKKRFAAIAGILISVFAGIFYMRSIFFNISDLWLIAVAAAVLMLLKFFHAIGQDRERTALRLDRFARVCSIILLFLAVAVLVPVLLRHFKVDFPPEFALYRKGERIIRPLLMLLLPLIWFNLAKGAKKNGRKLLLIGGAFAFLLFTLPLTLPWHIQREIYWHYRFESIAGELPSADTICFAEKQDVPFFSEFFKFPVKTVGNNAGEIKPADLKQSIEKSLQKSNILVVCSSKKLENSCPMFNGIRYSTGKFRLFYYYKNGVDKK